MEVDPETKALIARLAREAGVSENDLVARAVAAWLAHETGVSEPPPPSPGAPEGRR